MFTYLKSLAAAVLLACTSFGVAHATNPALPWGEATVASGRLTLNGIGTATGTPDMGEFTVSVVTIKPKLSDALKDNNSISADVMAALKGVGIEDADVKTLDFQTTENMVASEDGRKYVREGFRVVNSLHVCVRDINKNNFKDVMMVGAALQSVVDVGGDNVRVGNLAFKASNEKQMTNLARTHAVEDAKAKAELYAKAAGVKLGRIVEFSESSAGSIPKSYASVQRFSDAPGGGAEVAGGTHTVNVNVHIVWELIQ